MARSRTRVHVVSHTHWDREWYLTSQQFRRRLVRMADDLIETLERDPEYRHFHFDGQTIWLEDYLEIRPERRARLEALIRAGRIAVGPWYVMADEFLTSGEAHVRNLLRGHRLAESFGAEAAKIGFVSDTFGHNSQLPQILAGFGIDNAFFFRGMSGKTPAEILWEGADGTRVLLIKFPEDDGYGCWHQAFRAPFRRRPFDPEAALEHAPAYLAFKSERAASGVILAMDGNDHLDAEPRTPAFLRLLNERFPEYEFVHSSLEQFLADARPKAEGAPLVSGEVRSPAQHGRYNGMPVHTGSAHVDLKLANEVCQTLLERWAEPAMAWAHLTGYAYPLSYLDLAWKHLMRNHPHDSICGNSEHQVHEDMLGRFEEARQIAGDVAHYSLAHVAQQADTASLPGERALLLFNLTGAEAVEEVVEATLELPRDTGPEARRDLIRVRDAAGRDVPFQVLDMARGRGLRERIARHAGPSRSWDLVRVALPARIPALGWTALAYARVDPGPPGGLGGPKERAPGRSRTLAPRPGVLENDLIRVLVNANGTLDLTDKVREWTYKGLHVFADNGETGHAFFHTPPGQDRTVTSIGSAATVSTVCDGPLVGVLRVEHRLEVPESLSPDRSRRSDRPGELRVVTDVSLRRGSPRVDFRTTVYNQVRDHRLRVLFPSGIEAHEWHRDTAFDVVARRVELPDTSGWVEQVVSEAQQQSFAAIQDGERGLALFSRGIPEVAALDDERRTLALTLLRCFGSHRELGWHTDAQLQRTWQFEYALWPYAPQSDLAHVTRAADRYRSGVRSVTTECRAGAVAAEWSLAEIAASAPVVVSALKPADREEGRFVLRLFNPGSRAASVRLRFRPAVERAWRGDLNERAIESLPLAAGQETEVVIGPKRVETLLLDAVPVPSRVDLDTLYERVPAE
ncbi:MAG: hypothetical protein HY321_12090 [Armatimonadetes bacterium]|nr:hypothetical protein [Armatimonadota bacterium]